jgi:hypothetical protein
VCESSSQRSGVPGTSLPPAPAVPASAGEAAGMVLAGLGWLASADLSAVPVAVQADCLRALERAASAHVAARSAVLASFDDGCGHQADGHGTARTWLRWQTRITDTAASAATSWMRRLRARAKTARRSPVPSAPGNVVSLAGHPGSSLAWAKGCTVICSYSGSHSRAIFGPVTSFETIRPSSVIQMMSCHRESEDMAEFRVPPPVVL